MRQQRENKVLGLNINKEHSMKVNQVEDKCIISKDKVSKLRQCMRKVEGK